MLAARERWPDLPLLVVLSVAGIEDVAGALTMGASDVVTRGSERIHPVVSPDGLLSIDGVEVEMLGDIDASPIDHSYDQQIRDAFAGQFASALARPELRQALASGLHQLCWPIRA